MSSGVSDILFLYRMRTGCSLFLSLTHLRLTDFEPRTLPLARMPNLTHIAVPPPKKHKTLSTKPADKSYLDCPGVLENEVSPRLQMALLTIDLEIEKLPLRDLQDALAHEDERLYVVHAPCRTHHVQRAWKICVHGGESLWERALRERTRL
jgi:hypothetical protein